MASPHPKSVILQPDPRWQTMHGQHADLVSIAQGWPQSTQLPTSVCDMLRVSRSLFTHSFFVYEFGAVAVAWSLFAVEAALRFVLGVPDNMERGPGLGNLVDRGIKKGIIDKADEPWLRSGVELRNRMFAHPRRHVELTPGAVAPMVEHAHRFLASLPGAAVDSWPVPSQTDPTPTDRLPVLVAHLYRIVADLEALFPGRRFTPDGHLIGSMGEVLAAHLFDLELAPGSTTGFDARTRDGRTVEIKVTQRRTIALRGEEPTADLLVALRLADDGTAEVVYAGPASPVWDAAGPMASNGQRRVALSTLERMEGGGLEQLWGR